MLCRIGEVYWNEKLKTLLAIYVDDFKMAGSAANVKESWNLIRKDIKTDEPTKASKYLGAIPWLRTRIPRSASQSWSA